MNSIRNFRGLGGIKTSLGTVKNTLFRGGPLDTITPQDSTYFRDVLNIKEVFDFRSQDERKRCPNKHIEGVRDISLQLMPEHGDQNADPKEIMKKLLDSQFGDFMIPMYESLVTSPFTLKAHKAFLESIHHNPYASYFHCTAGKDRTGFSAALILKILGASMESIMDDYLMTNDQPKEAVDALLQHTFDVHQAKGHTLSDDDLRALVFVAPTYLEAAFKEIDAVYGDFDTYLTEGLKLDRAFIDAFREGLLE